MKFYRLVVVAFVLGLCACAKVTTFKTLPEGPINHHLIVVAKAKTGVRARGFLGATPPKTEIFFEIGKARANMTSNADGSFVIDITDADQDVPLSELTFLVGGKYYQQGYHVRDLPDSLSKISKDAFETDKEIDAVSFFDNSVAIISSQANLLRTFVLDDYFRPGDEPMSSTYLGKPDNVPLYPSAVSAVGEHLIALLNLGHEVALVSQNTHAVLAHAKVEDDQGRTFLFPMPAPLTVKNPLDADESGTPKTVITHSIARNPEGIVALDKTHFLVSFSNYYQFEDDGAQTKAVVGPGVVALMAIENDAIKTKAREVLNFKNPRHFVVKDKEFVWVIASGAYSNLGKDTFTSTDAGLVRLKIAPNGESFSIDHQIALTDFAPAPPALVNNKLVVPRLDKNEIAIIDESATAITDKDRFKPNFHREFGFTFAEHWHDDIVFLGDKKGTLVAYSLTEGFFVFPFVEPISIDKNVDERIGLRPQKLHFRHHVKAFDLTKSVPRGFTAWIVSDLQQKIYPADFLEVFGP